MQALHEPVEPRRARLLDDHLAARLAVVEVRVELRGFIRRQGSRILREQQHDVVAIHPRS